MMVRASPKLDEFADIAVRGESCYFVPHSGWANPKPIELPSQGRISHRPTIQIQELVALSYGVHPRCMTAKYRGTRKTSWARMVAMYLTRDLTDRSLPSIGKAFHRDHTTVIHAVRKVAAQMLIDPLDKADVLALRKVLTA